MPLRLTPGNSLTCRINAHRHGWNGEICADPVRWNCGAPEHFRGDYCATGDSRCFHINTFAADDPRFVIEGNGGDWIFEDDVHALDDQLLFFWTLRTNDETGIPEGYMDQRHTLIGAYRIKGVERLEFGYSNRWIVRPYADGWTDFSRLHARSARPDDAGGRYVKQLDRRDVERLFDEAERAGNGWADPATVERFRAFRAGYPKWIEKATERARAFAPAPSAPGPRPSGAGSVGTIDLGSASGGLGHKPLRGLEALRPATTDAAGANRASGATTANPTPAATPGAESAAATEASAEVGDSGGFLETAVRARVDEVYGGEVRVAIEVALATRDLVVLQGEPGVGKSYLALRLLDDDERERSLVVPVADAKTCSATSIRSTAASSARPSPSSSSARRRPGARATGARASSSSRSST